MRHLILLTLLLASLLIGCTGRGASSPTPFPSPGATLTATGGQPIELTVTELMSAPGLYVDVPVRVSGLLRKQPLIVCETDLQPSPAGWGLAEEGVLALAGGYDDQVRSLLPDDLMMTVEGRWRRWEGLVGCGKQAQNREVWYLEASRILSPSPLTQITLTPSGGVEIVALTGEPTQPGTGGEDFGTPTQSALAPVEPAEVTRVISEDTPDPSGGEPINPTTDFSASPTNAFGTTTPAGTPPAGTPPAGATPAAGQTGTPNGSPTPTPSGTPPTPTATTPGGGSTGQVVARGNFYDELFNDFIVASLAAGTTDSWELDVFADEPLYINVIAAQPADIVVSLLKDGQPIVNQQNTVPAGTAEFINNPVLQGDGLYEIQVSVVGGGAADYALTVYTDPEFPIDFPGIITYGTPRSAVQMPANGYHYWFFQGNAGDNVSILLRPGAANDVAVFLIDPTGEELDYIDDGFEGEEELLEATLPVAGLYAIGIEEFNGTVVTYDLTLSSN